MIPVNRRRNIRLCPTYDGNPDPGWCRLGGDRYNEKITVVVK